MIKCEICGKEGVALFRANHRDLGIIKIPGELDEFVMIVLDAGAALAGMLQTENIGIEKMVCNLIANPNIRYLAEMLREEKG